LQIVSSKFPLKLLQSKGGLTVCLLGFVLKYV
jgi:hypothetical protein